MDQTWRMNSWCMIPSWQKKVISNIFVLHWFWHAVLSCSDEDVFHCNDSVQFQGQNGMPTIHQGQCFQRNFCLLLPNWFQSEATDRRCSLCFTFSSCRTLCWHIQTCIHTHTYVCHAQIFGLICPSWAKGFFISQKYALPLWFQHFCLMKYVQNALRLPQMCVHLWSGGTTQKCAKGLWPLLKRYFNNFVSYGSGFLNFVQYLMHVILYSQMSRMCCMT
jgi:hypothetical protein